MNSPSGESRRFNAAGLATGSILVLIVAVVISTSVRAEGRSSDAHSLTSWEQRACGLARQDTPYALIPFFRRINRIDEGLDINDYVGKAVAERWELATQKTRSDYSLGSASAISPPKGTEKRADTSQAPHSSIGVVACGCVDEGWLLKDRQPLHVDESSSPCSLSMSVLRHSFTVDRGRGTTAMPSTHIMSSGHVACRPQGSPQVQTMSGWPLAMRSYL